MRGITLLEMVAVMGVVGILMAIAIPSYRYLNTSNRIAAEVNGLLGDLQYARSEAIKEGQTVSVCVSTNGTTCASGSTAWQNGWLVFADKNGNGSIDNATDVILRVQPAFPGNDTLVANNSISFVTFNREGFAAGLANGTLITLHAATPTAATTRCLSVTLIGLIAVQTYNGGTCT